MKLQQLLILIVLFFGITRGLWAADWITEPSTYTHDPMSGRRVNQYSPVGPFYNSTRSDYTTSGYRHTRSSIEAGGSVDHLHLVETWGRPVRPYEEWKYPFRPYSVPYQQWGPQPMGGMGGGGGGGGGMGGGGGGMGGGGMGGGGMGGGGMGGGMGGGGSSNGAISAPGGGGINGLPWNTDQYQAPNYLPQNLVPWRVIPQTPTGGPHGNGGPPNGGNYGR